MYLLPLQCNTIKADVYELVRVYHLKGQKYVFNYGKAASSVALGTLLVSKIY